MAKTKSKKAPQRKIRKTASSPRSSGSKQDFYRFVVSGPLKSAVDTAHNRMQKSRKYRRLASTDVHEVAREALDRGLQEIENELDEERERSSD